MASDDDQLDWLPSGWTLQIKKVNDRMLKCYLNPEGQKFYSKPQVLQYLNSSNNTASGKRRNADGTSGGVSLELNVAQQYEAPEPISQYNGAHTPGERSASQADPHLLVNEISGSLSLPDNWIVELNTKENGRKYKCYIDPDTGCKFYSKPAVFRYLKSLGSSYAGKKTESAGHVTGDGSNSQPNASRLTGDGSNSQPNASRLTGDGSNSQPNASQKDSNWLPGGWIMEVKTQDHGARVGMKYKCFTDPVSGRKFYSKPQVLNYLASINSGVTGKRKAYTTTGDKFSSEPDTSQKSKATNVGHKMSRRKRVKVRKSIDDEVISRTPAEGLPPGWVKEMRLRKNATVEKKDPYYVDPSSDYMFRSKLDALRYLETGDIKKCAIKPSLRDPNEKDSYNGEWASPTNLFGGNGGNETSEKLPDGWRVEVKAKSNGMKYKCYIDPVNGRKFHSKPQVFRYLKSGSSSKASGGKKEIVGLHVDGSSSKADASADAWLPDGWTMEFFETNYGVKRKCYTETVSGRKFYSRPQVHRYLAAKDSGFSGVPETKTEATGSKRGKSKKKGRSTNKLAEGEVISRAPADELPPGWIKEVRSRKNATQKDPYYVDPLSGYMFRSKLDAFRYLETGDITKCAIKPKKMDINETDTPVSEVDGQKPANTTAKRLHFEENNVETHDNNVPTNVIDTSLPMIDTPKTDPKTSGKTSVSTPTDKTATRTNSTRKSKNPPAALSGRTSKRLKGIEPETKGVAMSNKRATRSALRGPPPQKSEAEPGERNEAVQDGRGNAEKVKEKQANDEMAESEMSYPLGDSLWTDPCLDFAVKTLTGEMLGGGGGEPGSVESIDFEAGGKNKNEGPMKVN